LILQLLLRALNVDVQGRLAQRHNLLERRLDSNSSHVRTLSGFGNSRRNFDKNSVVLKSFRLSSMYASRIESDDNATSKASMGAVAMSATRTRGKINRGWGLHGSSLLV